MPFPYKQYETLAEPLQLYYPAGEETQARWVLQTLEQASELLAKLLNRPAPDEYPLWADEWQLQFAALWLAREINGQQGIVTGDLHQKYAEIFEPEEDGKTPVTVRGFDWYEDTSPEDYLCFDLLLEQFAADLLARSDPGVLPRFLTLYRKDYHVLLSDDVTEMLGSVLGPTGVEWLEGLVYF